MPAASGIEWEGVAMGDGIVRRTVTSLAGAACLGTAIVAGVLWHQSRAVAAFNCTITWTGASLDGQWTTPGNWNPVRVPGTGDFACVNSGTAAAVTLAGGTNVVKGVNAVGAGGFDVTGGSLELTDATQTSSTKNLSFTGGTISVDTGVGLTLSGTTSWSNTTMNGPGSATVPSGSTLTLNGPALQRGLTLLNAGTANWGSGGLCISQGAALNNAGTFNAQSDNNSIFSCGGSFAGRVHNLAGAPPGSFVKASANTITINVAFDNDGAVSVSSGTLQTSGSNSAAATDGGSYTTAAGATLLVNDWRSFSPSATVGGTGTLSVGGGATLAFNGQTIPNLAQSGGITTGSSTVSSTLSWTGGAMSGPGASDLLAGATMTLSNVNLRGGHVLTNSGTASWGSGTICMGEGAVFNNAGIFNAQSDNNSITNCFGGAASRFHNLGGAPAPSFTKASANSVSLNVPFDNDGAVSVTSGVLATNAGNSARAVDGGSYTTSAGATMMVNDRRILAAGASVAGAGTFTVAGSASLALNGQSIPTMVQTGGSTFGPYAVTSSLSWTGGNMSGTGTTTIQSGATATVGNVAIAGGHTLMNAGTVTWGSGGICLGQGAAVNNAGVFNAQSDNSSISNCLGGAAPRFHNLAGAPAGSLVKASANTVFIDVPFDNDGAVSVTSGILQSDRGNSAGAADSGSYITSAGATMLINDIRSLQPASTITGSGTLSIGGSALLALSNQLVPNLAQPSGTVSGPFRVSGAYNWTGGLMTGAGKTSVLAGATLTMSNASVGGGHTLANAGTATWGAGGFCVGQGAQFVNSGTFNAQADNQSIANCLGGASPRVLNQKTFTKASPNTVFVSVPFDNHGGVVVNSGTLQVSGGNSSGNVDTGSLTVALGATFLDTDMRTLGLGASAHGAGTLVVGNGGTVTFNAQNVPHLAINGGTTLGAYAVTGSLDWTNGTMSDALGAPTTTTLNAGVHTTVANSNLTGGHTVHNSGIARWATGGLCLGQGAEFDNAGTFAATSDNQSISDCFGGAASRFHNLAGVPAGAFTKASPNLIVVNVPFDNDGAVTVGSGTLQVNGGNSPGAGDSGSYTMSVAAATMLVNDDRTLNASATVTGAGVLSIGGSAHLNLSGQSIPHLALTAGVTRGAYTVVNTFVWTGGFMSDIPGFPSTTTVASGATATVSNAGLTNGHALANSGTITWTAGSFCFGEGAALNNAATFNAEADGNAMFNCFGGAAPQFNNQSGATFKRTGGTNTITVGIAFANAGKISVATGTLQITGDLLEPAGGTIENVISGVNAGTGFGQLQVTGQLTLGGTLQLTNNAFTPAASQTFIVITCNSCLGTFGSVTTNGNYTVQVNPTTVVATAH